jgi:hypothetical protein
MQPPTQWDWGFINSDFSAGLKLKQGAVGLGGIELW